jgi:hypothetical protein
MSGGSAVSTTPDKRAASQRRYNARLRTQVIEAKGGKCECCGDSEPRFLTLDHVNGDGAAHRRQYGDNAGNSTQAIYRWVRDHPCDPAFRLLCYNCNCGRGASGRCPHEEDSE